MGRLSLIVKLFSHIAAQIHVCGGWTDCGTSSSFFEQSKASPFLSFPSAIPPWLTADLSSLHSFDKDTPPPHPPRPFLLLLPPPPSTPPSSFLVFFPPLRLALLLPLPRQLFFFFFDLISPDPTLSRTKPSSSHLTFTGHVKTLSGRQVRS